MTIAVKNVKRVLSLLIAITVLLSFTAYADVAITNPATHTVGVSENITVTVTGATSGEEVALLIYDTTVTSENILYVDQKTATGSDVAFEFGIRSGFDVQKTYIVKAGSTNSSAAATGSLVFEEITVNGIKITANPTKTVYSIGDTLDTTGLAVQEAVDGVANGTAVVGYTTTGFDTTTAGAKLVVVTSDTYSDTFAIFVKPAVTVNEPAPVAVSDVTVDNADKDVEVAVGGTEDLVYTVAPNNAANKEIEWLSLDSSIATVSNGVVTGVGLGATEIIGLTKDGAFKFSYNVNVVAADIEEGIVGRIVNASNVGIYGATITYADDIAGDDVTVTTDANGYFKLPYDTVSNENEMLYGTLSISAAGYVERAISVEVYDFEDALISLTENGSLKLLTPLYGDVTGDGEVNMTDVSAAFSHLNDVLDYGEN